MATLVKISKIERQAEIAAARAEYIHSAEVSLHGDYADVRSRTDEGETYRVGIEGGLPISCDCKDFYWRSKKDPSHVCLHMDATQIKLCATLPLIGTPEMASLIRSVERIFKVCRSAPNAQLIASLQKQLPAGAKVHKIAKNARKNANAFVLVCPPVVALLSPVVELMAA